MSEEQESPFRELIEQSSDMSQQIDKIAAALSKAQGEMSHAKKDKENPFHESTYADLAGVWDACRDVLSKNSLAVVQVLVPTDGKTVSLRTLLVHSSGQWFRGTLTMIPVKSDPQSITSCITYMRRTSLSAITGNSPQGEDDDGEMATRDVVRTATSRVPRIEAAESSDQGDNTCPGCSGRMMVSKYPNKSGVLDWYCSKCKLSKPRSA